MILQNAASCLTPTSTKRATCTRINPVNASVYGSTTTSTPLPNSAKKLRERNESLDLRVYNLAALEILNPNMERIMENLQVTEGDEVAEDQPQTVKTAPKRKPPSSGFATSWK